MDNDTENSGNSIVFTKKTFSIGVAVLLVAIILGFWGVYYYSSTRPVEETPQSTTTEVEQVQRSLTGKSLEEDKKDVLSATQSILEASAISPDEKTVPERVEALDKGDMSVVDPSLTEKIRFVGEFKDDEGLQRTTYQALITLSTYTNEEGSIEPISEEIWEQVHVDQEAGIAYVPISAFYGPGASFSIEMVFSDGEWKMAPYSLLDIINLSALLQQQDASQG